MQENSILFANLRTFRTLGTGISCVLSPTVIVAPFLVVAAFGVDLATKHVEAVADVKHGVGVDAVVARVAASAGVDPPFVVALLAEEIVEVKRHDKRLALEERLGELPVPDELVGVARGVVIAAAAVRVEVSGELEALWQPQHDLPAIAKTPGVEVGRWLQLVARVLVVDVAIDGHLQPVVAEAEVQTLVDVGGTGGVLLCIGLFLSHVAHVVVVAQACVGTDVPVGCRVEGGVEVEAAVSIPVAVDVLRP